MQLQNKINYLLQPRIMSLHYRAMQWRGGEKIEKGIGGGGRKLKIRRMQTNLFLLKKD